MRVYSAAHLPEAYLLLHRLAHAGIEARVLNEHAQGAIGQIPFGHAYPELWLVDPADEARARRVIRDYEARPDASENMFCPRCGEENPVGFETCWQCGSSLASG